MRLVLLDGGLEGRSNFYPLTLSRPLWELRCGMTTLVEKLLARVRPTEVACFVPPYMADSYRPACTWKVNDPTCLKGDDLLLVNPRIKAEGLPSKFAGNSEVGVSSDGTVLYVRISRGDLARLKTDSAESLLDSARQALPVVTCGADTWNYVWDLVLANPAQIAVDFAAAGRSGVEGTVEQPAAIRGGGKDVYVALKAVVHPMVVLDASAGPIYIDEEAVIHPFTRIEGPCYVGRKSILLGAKCREGNSIGPVCRIGGEVEESIIQGHSNKYHDGFLGHAYVGEWVNLGALTTNSDLKNDYGTVAITIEGGRPVDTGSTKVGAIIGDHTKTSIGTLFNTGSYVGAMGLIMATGKPLPKTISSFAWLLDGVVTKGFGKGKLYETAAAAMKRRGKQWTDSDQAMWDAVYEMTAPARDEAIRRGRRQWVRR